MNRDFARIVEGRVQFAPDVLEDFPVEFPPSEEGGAPRIVSCTVANPAPDKLRAAGYLDVITSPEPEPVEGYHWVPEYTVQFDDTVGLDVICQIWEREADPNPEDRIVTPEEFIDIVFKGVR